MYVWTRLFVRQLGALFFWFANKRRGGSEGRIASSTPRRSHQSHPLQIAGFAYLIFQHRVSVGSFEFAFQNYAFSRFFCVQGMKVASRSQEYFDAGNGSQNWQHCHSNRIHLRRQRDPANIERQYGTSNWIMSSDPVVFHPLFRV